MICDQLEMCIDNAKKKIQVTNCKNDSKDCLVASDFRSNIKCEERKKKYVLENTLKNHVMSYRMDGGIIKVDKTVPEGISKCDYLLVINGMNCDAILVELKGTDVSHALKQIDGTLERFKSILEKFSHVYARAVITSTTPNLKASPAYVNLVKKLKKTYNGNLRIAEVQLKEKDVNLKDKCV